MEGMKDKRKWPSLKKNVLGDVVEIESLDQLLVRQMGLDINLISKNEQWQTVELGVLEQLM